MILLAFAVALATQVPAGPAESYVRSAPGAGRFALASGGHVAPLVVSAEDYPGVIRAVNNLRRDLGRVTTIEPIVSAVPTTPTAVLIGTVGHSPLIDGLVRSGKLDATNLAGQWETFVIQVVEHPLPGLERALVIAGSDKRGTIFGSYELSSQIGVSPWTWWADVPVPRRRELFIEPGRHTLGSPAVRYRGFFINDEAPALSGWTRETFGGFNHQFYEHVFELLLRMKANYLWPAMWGSAFNEDDTLNNRLADEYGIVMGTSHHEPMLRAQQEWRRHGTGAWNYDSNADTLRSFWRRGIVNLGSHESIVTVGMRGDGDMPMSRESNIGLLERIVADQRQIIADVTGRPASETPQLWALYKEVQGYYDQGMRVPDDVTLLFADDNWGNVRRLPALGAASRAGGYGLYYHFDYVGGPRNYKWINTNAIPRIWEQLNLTYSHGVDRIWIVNVGDIKPLELPTQFFLDYAWNPARWPLERLPEYTRRWAEQQFGPEQAPAIAALLDGYTRFTSRRKPEMVSPATFALNDYHEAETVVADYQRLVEQAARVARALPAPYHDAFYQLVQHPIEASANLNELYIAAARNRLYAAQGRATANDQADRVRQLFARDAAISRYYNDTLAGGKWRHMMDQTHIGYTTWQEPRQNNMPEVREITLPAAAALGVAIEGSDRAWPADSSRAVLPELSPFGPASRSITVFNRGQAAFDYQARADVAWVTLTPSSGRIDREQRLEAAVDWRRAPRGRQSVAITITGAGSTVVVNAPVFVAPVPRYPVSGIRGFVEASGYIAMEAEHYTRAVSAAPVQWARIPGLGRTLSGMTPMPVTAPRQTPGGDAPRLEYGVVLFDSGDVTVRATFSPTLDYLAAGLRYAASFDDEPPQVVNVVADSSLRTWERWVGDNANVAISRHHLASAGAHVLHFWMVDPGLVLQGLVVAAGELRPSYLGPPESFRTGAQR